MQYNTLGATDIKVSELCLGTMTFGEQNTETEAHAQLDLAIETGINFIDTAEMYAIPPKAETYGLTETYIGRWLQKTGRRDQLILATKVIGQADWMPHVRGGKARLDRSNIEQAVDGSLRRLQTDYIDLYQIHWPDRATNFFGKLGYQYQEDQNATPIAETLSVLSDFVKAGKIRYVGISNETPWGTMKYLQLCERPKLPRIVSIQNPYNLLNRTFEIGLAEVSHRENVSLLPYSPLAFGVLTGKYLNAQPSKARLTLFPGYARYSNASGLKATQAYVDLARRYNIIPSQMALAFINSRPFVCSNIIGATTTDQLKENIGSLDVQLDENVLKEIDDIHQIHSNPCP